MSPPRYLYAISTTIQFPENDQVLFYNTPFAIIASSVEEARAEALKALRTNYPEEKGWIGHTVTVRQVADEIIVEAAASLQGRLEPLLRASRNDSVH